MPLAPRRYAEVREDAIHPDFAPGGVAHRVGHLLRQVAAGEHEYPVSGEHATVALVHGPEATDFAKFGEALASEGHPLAGEFNWPQVNRGIIADKAVLGYLRTNGLEPHQLFNHLNMHDHAFHNRSDLLNHLRKYIPDANHKLIDRVTQRMLFPHVNSKSVEAHRYARKFARVPDAEVHEHLRGLRVGSVLQKLAGEHAPGHEPAGHSAIAEAILRGDMSHLNFSALADALEERGHPLAKAFNWRGAGPKIELDMKVRDTLRRHGFHEMNIGETLRHENLESNGGMVPDELYQEAAGHAHEIAEHNPGVSADSLLRDSLNRISTNTAERDDEADRGDRPPHQDSGHAWQLPAPHRPAYYRRCYATRAPKGGMIDPGVDRSPPGTGTIVDNLWVPGGEFITRKPLQPIHPLGTAHKASAVTQGVYTDPRTGAKFRHDKAKGLIPVGAPDKTRKSLGHAQHQRGIEMTARRYAAGDVAGMLSALRGNENDATVRMVTADALDEAGRSGEAKRLRSDSPVKVREYPSAGLVVTPAPSVTLVDRTTLPLTHAAIKRNFRQPEFGEVWEWAKTGRVHPAVRLLRDADAVRSVMKNEWRSAGLHHVYVGDADPSVYGPQATAAYWDQPDPNV